MAFDGINYHSANLSPPIHGHPDTPAVGDALHDGLVGAYLYARKQAQHLGTVTFNQFLRNRFANSVQPGQFAQTALVDFAEIQAFVPEYATHLGAILHYRVFSSDPTFVYGQLGVTDTGGTDTSTTVSEEVPPFADTAYVPVSGRLGAGSRLATYVPYFFELQRYELELALSNITQEEQATITARMYGQGESGNSAVIRPEQATFFFWAEG